MPGNTAQKGGNLRDRLRDTIRCHSCTSCVFLQGPMEGKFVCFQCDDLCLTCRGPGEVFCAACKYYSLNVGTTGQRGRCVQ